MPEVPHDETVGLRLELHREKARADAFEAAFRREVLAVINSAAKDEISSELIHDLRMELMHKDEELEACHELIAEIKTATMSLAEHLSNNAKSRQALAYFKKAYDLP
jgi:signal recognition particle GTPase